MGCGQSKSQQTKNRAASPPSNTSERKSAVPNVTTQNKPVTPNQQNPHNAQRPTPPKSSTTYETHLSASLVDSSNSSVPFHGLLNNDRKLDLKRHPNPKPENKLLDRACHPCDDVVAAVADPRLTVVKGVAMTMPYTIIVPQPDVKPAIEKVIQQIFATANATFNAWNGDSEVSAMNKLPPEKKVPVSSQLMELFEVVDMVFEMTDGRFDPTSGVLSVAFENCINHKKRPPLPAEIAPFKHAIGWNRRFVRKAGTASRMNAHTVLDFDGISKGFVIDVIVRDLMNAGFYDCYVDWAGDIRAVGSHPDGRPWRSAVVRPPELARVFSHWKQSTLHEMITENDIAYFADFCVNSVNGCAIATSGDYFAMHKYGFHHIVNLNDMSVMKATYLSIGSVCVAANRCAIADAIATAAMTFQAVDDAVEFLEKLKSSHPNMVYGYCVMGRNRPKKREVEMITSDIFSAADWKSGSTPSQGEGSEPNSNSIENSEALAARASDRLYKSLCEVQFGGSVIEIDSFVSCSMDPQPLVTFIAPFSFVRHASEAKNDVLTKFKLVLLRPDDWKSSPQPSGVFVDLRFSDIIRIDDVACVSAIVEDVDFGIVRDFTVVHDGVTVKREIELGIVRSKFQLLPALDKARTLMRNVPSMVWVVSTTTEDGSPVALTATSVCIPQDGHGLMYFNVSHSSAFYAHLGGEGNVVKAFALSTSSTDLASKFISDCRPTDTDVDRLQSESIVVAACVVSHKRNLQDHLVVIGTVCEVFHHYERDSERRPLLWIQGGYLSW